MTNIIQKSHNYSKSYLPQNNTKSQEKKQEQLPRNDSNQGNQQNFQTKGSLIDRIKEIYAGIMIHDKTQKDADKVICDYFSISESEYNYLKEYINGNT